MKISDYAVIKTEVEYITGRLGTYGWVIVKVIGDGLYDDVNTPFYGSYFKTRKAATQELVNYIMRTTLDEHGRSHA